MVKTILLTQGKSAIVDDEDFDELNKYKWFAHRDPKNGMRYAKRNTKSINGKQGAITMHRQIMGSNHKMIDHINRDGLDNRKCNLRPCTSSQNQKNVCIRKDNTSGLIGVNKSDKKWMARITKNKNRIYLGLFDNKDEAGLAVDKKAIEIFGEFVTLNFPEK